MISSENLFAPVIYNDKEGVGIDYRVPAAGRTEIFSDILDNDNVGEILFSLREGNPPMNSRMQNPCRRICETISDAYKKTKTVGEANDST